MNFEWFYEKFDDKQPLVNPITYQYNRNFNGPFLGNGGKLYYKRGRMNDGIFIKHDEINYAVPAIWNCPSGFNHDGYSCWTTKSELLAMRYFREYNNAQNHLKIKWKDVIERQNYLYSLSRYTDYNIDLPKTVKSTFKARNHQKLGIKFGNLTNGKFIIADQQRTGKSYTALLYSLSQEWDRCLIVCPSKVVPIWADETKGMIRNISDIPIHVLKTNDVLRSGYNVVSYDTLHTIDNLECDIVIADEAHFFLENGARRSKAMDRIISDKRIALTGTPIMNDISNILSILNWVDSEIADEIRPLIESVKEEDSYTQSKIVGEELRRRCLLLRETHQVSNGNEPYINFITIDTKISNPKDLQEVGRAKVNYAVEYCNSFKDKILVVFYYKETGRMLQSRLGNKAVLIDGDSSPSEIKEAKESFENGTQILLGSTVLAEGLDFSFCNNILMVEESSYSMRTDQIRERCNRVNKEEEVTIDILIVPGTQDDRLYELLGNKFALSHGLRDS